MGDSKTQGAAWPEYLLQDLSTATGFPWYEKTPRPAFGGYTVATMRTYLEANMASIVGHIDISTINLGVANIATLPAAATWKADLIAIIDLLRTHSPSIKIYIARVWRRTFEAECDDIAVRIDEVVATYPSDVFVGMDERVWLEGGDDGATYTTDGIHYTSGAQPVAATAWKVSMGY